MKIIQLTDLHLFAEPDVLLREVPTRDSFLNVFDVVESQHSDADFLIFTGDFTHDEKLETYHFIRETLGDWIPRCRLVPGNHDDRSLIRSVFPEIVSGGAEFINFSVQADSWRLIGIDTHLPGEVSGNIESEQLNWLEQELKEHSNSSVALFMHHPPISVESEWLDRLGIQEPERFQQIVKSSENIRVICTGHVHQEFTGQLGQADVFSTPSTGVQFTPRQSVSTNDSIPPGFRILTLDGDNFQTEVIRVPEST